jgi:adenosylmethionine-8-amino-7-oxononanoate aminotransferase
MSDLLILGTDTDAGKTTFALLWLAAFAERYAYWKPVETGPSDSERVRQLVSAALVHPPVLRLRTPVAPPLAARQEGAIVPPAAVLAAARPASGRSHLLVESFGSPFSPLNESELQHVLVRRLDVPVVLVASSALGAIGRTLQAWQALATVGIRPRAVVLVGPADPYAVEQIAVHSSAEVFSLTPPGQWDPAGVEQAARQQQGILDALAAALGVTRPATAPAAWVRRDRQVVWHPYTSLREPDDPLVVTGAEGEFLTLADGRRLIDGISSWWTILHGHRHPPLVAALEQAIREIDHVHFAGVTHPWAVELAELLLQTAPWPDGRVFYSDNGSTAVEVALKMAYQFWCHQGEPGRTHFVGFRDGYHGDTFGAMAASRDPVFFGRFEPLLFEATILPLDIEQLDCFLTRESGRTAGVILEPLVQGAGGMRMHTLELLRQLAEVTRRHGVLFIADEVFTGGRVGYRWAHQAAGIAPDLICVGKTLAGGLLSLAATLAAPHVVQAWDTDDRARTFFHGHSFTAHPLACAVACANFGLLPESLDPVATEMERFWQERLGGLRDRPGVKDVRIRGTIAAVELDTPGGYLADIGRQLRRVCIDEGVLLRPLGSVLYTVPPRCTGPESLERIVRAIHRAVAAVGELQQG